MNDYIQSPKGFSVRTDVSASMVDQVSISLAPIELGDDGTSRTLAVGPCQHIYRWAFDDVPSGAGGVASPFLYSEIDWNTEGLPRGPNNSFQYPHFDFHFYTKPGEVMRSLTCDPMPPTDRVCDPFTTDYERMREFQLMVKPQLMPPTYRADVGSAIPEMGLHYLDTGFDYTVESVNHHPTLLYGSYGGEIIFIEASVTIFTLQDVKAAPGRSLSWPFPQPTTFAETPISWPTQFRLTYLVDSDVLEASFAGFARHQ